MADSKFVKTGDPRLAMTGAKRDANDDKGRFDLIPWVAVERWAHRMQGGAKHYGDRNWEKGLPASWFVDSLARHLTKYILGHHDEDHLAAILFNAGGLMYLEAEIEAGRLPRELMDLPYRRHLVGSDNND